MAPGMTMMQTICEKSHSRLVKIASGMLLWGGLPGDVGRGSARSTQRGQGIL